MTIILLKSLADELNMFLSQFGEQAWLSACEIIKAQKKPVLTKFYKGGRFWIHEADESKQNF